MAATTYGALTEVFVIVAAAVSYRTHTCNAIIARHRLTKVTLSHQYSTLTKMVGVGMSAV